MFYYFYKFFYDPETTLSFLRIFRYLSVRSIGALITGFFIYLIIAPYFIRWLKRHHISDINRDILQVDTSFKKGTPTMGGILLLVSVIISMLLWGNLLNRFTQFIIWSIIPFGLLGAYDDFLCIGDNQKIGLARKYKLLGQIIFGLIIGIILLKWGSPFQQELRGTLWFPFVKNINLYIGIAYIFWVAFVITSMSNAVNFADGLDGLAIVPVMTTMMVLGVFAYVLGNIKIASYLQFTYIPNIGELIIPAAAILGAAAGFLWFNAYPAQIFMGDVGSITLGALLGIFAILVKQELLLPIAGGIFLAEALSVLLQMVSIKFLGRRIIPMSPMHHSLQYRGQAEVKVVVRLWMISAVLMIIGLSALKLR